MTRHITDRPKTRSDAARLRQALRQDRAGRAHPATLALQRRPRGMRAGPMLRAFLRIERGAEA